MRTSESLEKRRESTRLAMRKRRKTEEYKSFHRDYIKQYVMTSNGFVVHLLNKLKAKSKKFGLPFNLTKEDLIPPEFCPILNIKLNLDRKDSDLTPSADRLIPELGYVKGNVRMISMRANRIKSDASLKEIEQIFNYMKLNLQ